MKMLVLGDNVADTCMSFLDDARQKVNRVYLPVMTQDSPKG